MLVLNGYELDAAIDEQEKILLELADGSLGRDRFVAWVHQVMVPLTSTT